MSTSKVISEFWSSFQKNSEALSRIETADDPVYDELLEKAAADRCWLIFRVQGWNQPMMAMKKQPRTQVPDKRISTMNRGHVLEAAVFGAV